ncbi:hypothetical protein EG329_008397 [Mollisiaceae sp. DMI_Dod_QoI]|nr:hypothetical protein EG329_008397 [Helotiales sp. DMI_Dod_QoI]
MGPLSPLPVNRPTMQTSSPYNDSRHMPKSSHQTSASQSSGKKSLRIKLFGRSSSSTESSSPMLNSPSMSSPPMSSPEMEPVSEEDLEGAQSSFDQLVIKPSPFHRPCKGSLEPRIEANGFARPLPTVNSTDSISPITRARKRGETKRYLVGDDIPSIFSGKEMSPSERAELVRRIERGLAQHGTAQSTQIDLAQFAPTQIDLAQDIQPPIDQHHLQGIEMSQGPCHQRGVMGTHQIDSLDNFEIEVKQLAQRLSHYNNAADWWVYLGCYFKGQFNPNNLPEAHPINLKFTSLRALSPPDETKRFEACRELAQILIQSALGHLSETLKAATSQFDPDFLTLSGFDKNYEMLLVNSGLELNNGFKNGVMYRNESLAAHAMYSVDVMVVLDTDKDWRFKKNPYVISDPAVRFFAAAPMVTSDGHILAVLTIYGKKPRDAFTFHERRTLSGICQAVMDDLENTLHKVAEDFSRQTPLLDRNSRINGDRSHREIDVGLIPPALRIYKAAGEPTPPPSADSNADFHTERFANFNLKAADVSGKSGLPYVPSIGYSAPQFTTEFTSEPEPRPFSSSDLSSLYPEKPCSPFKESKTTLSYAPTIDEFHRLTDSDVWYDVDTADEQDHVDRVSINTAATTYPKVKSVASEASKVSTTSTSGADMTSHYQGSMTKTIQAKECSHKDSMTSIASSIGSAFPLEARTKAEDLCQRIGPILKYDLVYLAQLVPSEVEMADGSRVSKTKAWIIAKSGTADVKKVDIDFLCKAIRQVHIQRWEPDLSKLKPDDLASGDLIPIHFDDDSKSITECSSGFVVVCLRTLRTHQSRVASRSYEATQLAKLKTNLRKLLFAPPKNYRSNTDPNPSYPANEATEVVVPPIHSYHSSLPVARNRHR